MRHSSLPFSFLLLTSANTVYFHSTPLPSVKSSTSSHSIYNAPTFVMLGFTTTFLVVLPILSWCLFRIVRIGTREPGLPPGPPTIPILGNALMVPRVHLHLKLTEFAKQYGKIFSLKFANQTMVVLNDPNSIRELMDNRSATTSDRPGLHVVDTITSGMNVPFMRYGPIWKGQRRVLKGFLSREASMKYLPIQKAEAAQLMYDFLKEPVDFVKHIERYTASFILSTCFGLRCPRHADSYVSTFYAVQRDFETLVSPGGAPPVDLFPILKYVPERWAKWKTTARDVRRRQLGLYSKLLVLCKRRIQEDKRTGCFIEEVLDDQEKYQMNEETLISLTSALVEAGSDTTSLFLQNVIAFITAHPEVQKKAYEELDRVVGQSRSPVLADHDNLPYLNAIIKEVHRMRPIAPLLLPHAATATEMIDGYVVPQGSMIVANIWALGHDEGAFDEPERFNPDRFLNSEFGTRPGVDNSARRHDFSFGCGRRMCPGMHLATNSIILNTMNFLWAFRFDLTEDPHTRKPIPVDVNNVTDVVMLGPKPFKCSIQPRSGRHIEIIRSEYAAAREVSAAFEQDLTEVERQYVQEW